MSVVDRIREVGIIPVVRATSADEALKSVEAILRGGIPVIEVTLTVPGAIEVIKALTSRFDESVVIGAGTVLDSDTARQCIDVGARFIVSPALDIPTIDTCDALDVPMFPGAMTPTEAVAAWRAHAPAVKIFPASAVGGPTFIKSMKAPLPQIELIPTGGVTVQNTGDYIKAGALAVGVGADLVKGDPATISAKAREYVAAVKAAR